MSVECFLCSSVIYYFVLHEPFLVIKFPSLKYTFFLHTRRHQDTWSRSSPSWYQEDWESSTFAGDKTSDGNAGWGQQDTRGTSSSGHADKTGTWEETKEKFLNVTPDELLAIAGDPEQQGGVALARRTRKN